MPAVAPPFRRNQTNDLVAAEIEFVPHPLFPRADAEQRIERLKPQSAGVAQTAAPHSSALPSYLAALYQFPLLSREEEWYLFTRMNFLKFRAEQDRRKFSRRDRRPSTRPMCDDLAAAMIIRNQIVQSNLRLVVSLAKQLAVSRQQFHEFVSEGHLPLIRAVELFDVRRGYRFSTYAMWAVRNQMLRARKQAARQTRQVCSGEGEWLEALPDHRVANIRTGDAEPSCVPTLLTRLSERERLVIAIRYGLDGFDQPHSLAQISSKLNLSKERVRQIALQATEKLQEAARQVSA